MDPYIRKVRFWDVDANGHVFNARHLVYVDDALTDLLEESGLDFDHQTGDGFLMVLARTEIDYVTEAVIGDVLATTVVVAKVGTSSIEFEFEITEQIADRMVAKGKEIYVTIDSEQHRPIPVPDEVRDLLS